MANKETLNVTDMFQSMMPANDMFKSAVEFNARLSNIFMETASKNNELAYNWAQDNIKKMQTLADPKIEPSKLAEKTAEVFGESMQAAPEQIAKFAEVAKTAQTEAVELIMEAGKRVQSDIVETTKGTKPVVKAA